MVVSPLDFRLGGGYWSMCRCVWWWMSCFNLNLISIFLSTDSNRDTIQFLLILRHINTLRWITIWLNLHWRFFGWWFGNGFRLAFRPVWLYAIVFDCSTRCLCADYLWFVHVFLIWRWICFCLRYNLLLMDYSIWWWWWGWRVGRLVRGWLYPFVFCHFLLLDNFWFFYLFFPIPL